MKVFVYINFPYDNPYHQNAHAMREVEWPAVPRVGDDIELTGGGWSEPVEHVYWNLDGSATIQCSFRSWTDECPELIGDLRAEGWTVSE